MSRETAAGDFSQARGTDGVVRFGAPRFVRMHMMTFTAIASLVTGFLLWEAVARFIVRDKLFLVAPSAVIVRFGELWQTGDLQRHIIASGEEFVLGMVAASLV